MTGARVITSGLALTLVVMAGCAHRREPRMAFYSDQSPRPSQAELVHRCVSARPSLRECRVDADTLIGPQHRRDPARVKLLSAVLSSEATDSQAVADACGALARNVPEELPARLVAEFEENAQECAQLACAKQAACFRPMGAILVAPE